MSCEIQKILNDKNSDNELIKMAENELNDLKIENENKPRPMSHLSSRLSFPTVRGRVGASLFVGYVFVCLISIITTKGRCPTKPLGCAHLDRAREKSPRAPA